MEKKTLFKDKHGKALAYDELKNKTRQRFYAILEELLVFLINISGYVPSHLFRRFVYRLSGIKIGKGSTIHTKAVFYCLGDIKIGNDTIVGEKATLDARGKIRVGNHTDIASEVIIYTAQHDINSETFASKEEPVEIEDYVFVGPRVIILPGVKIGQGAVVGAGAVVTKNVEPFSVVGGIPAKPIAERELKNLKYSLGRAKLFR